MIVFSIGVLIFIPVLLLFWVCLQKDIFIKNWLCLFLTSLFLWGVSICSLYLGVDKTLTLWLMRISRVGQLMLPYIVYSLSYDIYKNYLGNYRKYIKNGKILFYWVFMILWVVNLTPLSIKDLHWNGIHYVVVYGSLHILYVYYFVLSLLTILLLYGLFHFVLFKNIEYQYIVKRITIVLLMVYVLGMLNFIPSYRYLFGLVAILVGSVYLVLEFVVFTDKKKIHELEFDIGKEKVNYLDVYSSLVHELKNPFFAIKGYVSYLKNDDLDYNDFKNIINNLDISINYLDNILNSFTRFIKNNDLDKRIITLNHLVEMLRGVLGENNKVVITNQVGRSIFLNIDVVKIVQCIVNLVINSMNAYKKKGLDDEVKVTIELNGYNDLCITIEDKAGGIPKEVINNLEKPKVSKKGFGLGLALSYQIVRLHGGYLDMDVEEGIGTKVIIRIPTN